MIENEKEYCTLYIVRHGETEANKNHVVQGVLDAPLTPEGVSQAQATAKDLRHIHFDAIFSSDLPRTRRTAEIIKLDRELAIQTTKLLRERHYGEFEGKPTSEYHAAVDRLLEEKERLTEQEQWKFSLGKDMETDEELAERMLIQLREIAVSHQGKTVLVITHGGAMRMFLTRIGYAKYGELPGGTVRNAAYAKILSDGIDFFVKEVKGIEKRIR
jgi:broad specificity phosphatase PhoE